VDLGQPDEELDLPPPFMDTKRLALNPLKGRTKRRHGTFILAQRQMSRPRLIKALISTLEMRETRPSSILS
jgi:hypothetical protein